MKGALKSEESDFKYNLKSFTVDFKYVKFIFFNFTYLKLLALKNLLLNSKCNKNYKKKQYYSPNVQCHAWNSAEQDPYSLWQRFHWWFNPPITFKTGSATKCPWNPSPAKEPGLFVSAKKTKTTGNDGRKQAIPICKAYGNM